MKEKFSIIVTDDDAEMRGLYAEVFRNDGFEVREAKDGLEALEMVNQKAPDVLFTGIVMPRMDGFTLVESLKKSVVTASIPVVFFSHLGREEDQKHAMELGVKKFIVQGMMSVNDVVRTVRSLLTTSEYFISIDPRSLDAQKLAQDFSLNANFLCDENGGQQLALKLSVTDAHSRTFEAKLICV
ncbi:MAG: response regulator [Candidatus Moranbacteria bacterium]|nr:response regulator [Candidatus Moranbacteria bacterium]